MSADGQPPLASRCAHCDEPLATPAAAPAYCCHGCATAAAWIRDAGLGDYYRWRQGSAQPVGDRVADYRAWDRDTLLAQISDNVGKQRRITLVVDGMRCAACAWLIQKALGREPGVVEVTANAMTGRVLLLWEPESTRLSPLLRRLAELGYPPGLPGQDGNDAAYRRERRRSLLRLGIALLAAVQTMMFAEALYLDGGREMVPATRDFFRWISFLVATPVVFFSGWPFLLGAWREWRERSLGMDTLIGTGTLVAYLASLVETLRGGPQVWFDAAVMFVLFMGVARHLEHMARQRAGARLDALARAQPQSAVREADGQHQLVPVTDLQPGDVVVVAVGAALPADGVLLHADAWVDESLLTGEALAVKHVAGAVLRAGSVARESSLRLRVTAVGAATQLSQFSRLAEHALQERPRWQRLAERVAHYFVLAIVPLTAAVAGLWWWIDPAQAFPNALAVWVVTCPCALALAIPAALASAQSALSREGLLVIHPDALEALASVDTAVFDKTGTLTRGMPTIRSATAFGDWHTDQVLAIAGQLEAAAGHPLAAAFSSSQASPISVEATPGLGISGVIEGAQWRIGRADFATCEHADDGAVWLACNGVAAARFEVGDALRPDAANGVRALHDLGVTTAMLSGDAPAAVQEIAASVGIDDARARCLPEDKLASVRERQAAGHRVLMVGDGINDAAVLAGADVAIAMAGGSALARQRADLVIIGDQLDRVPFAVRMARRTQRVIHQNLWWAVGYNVVMLPLAALGYLHPGWAALGMTLSSLTVTANALRLLKVTPA